MNLFRRVSGRLAGSPGVASFAGLLAIALAAPSAAQTQPRAAGPAPAEAKARKPAPARPAEDDEAAVSELVVTGDRPQPGAVVGDIKPELQLSPADIRSYGVSTMAELLDELAPQIRSDRGRGGEAPAVLLNGKRISGFNEIRDIPTEAILRVDILPEEAALKYGYSANQRVVNIVLRPRFRAVTNELTGGGPTEGGQASGQAEVDLFRTRRDARINLDLKYSASSALTEADRDLTSLASGQPFDLRGNLSAATPGAEIDPALSALVGHPVTVAGAPAIASTRAPTLADFAATAGVANTSDVRRYRTLSPETQQVSLNAVLSRGVLGGLSATVNATLEATSSESRQGLPGVSLLIPAGDPFSPFGRDVELNRYLPGLGPLTQSTDSWTGHLGGALNRDLKGWRLALTGAYDHVDTQTDSDVGIDTAPLQALLNARSATFNPYGAIPGDLLAMLAQDQAHSVSDTANIQFVASGPLWDLPAGKLRANLKLGETGSWFDSASDRLGVSQSVDLSRTASNLQASFDVPLASKRNNFLPALGELSANVNLAADQVSKFGTLTTLGYGLNWTPATGVTFTVSHTRDQAAPTVQQLGDPVVLTPGARIFDFATGRTVDVTRIDGGEAGLAADHRDVLKLGLTYKPLADQDLTFTANYVESRIDNAIASLPAATAEIEAAFPDRFLRDAQGDLVQVDFRPVNFAREERKELRWGVNFSKGFGPPIAPPPFRVRPDGARPDGARPDRARNGEGARGEGFGPPPGGPPDGEAGPPPPGGPGGGEGGGPPGGFGGPGGGGPGGGGFGGGGFGGGGGFRRGQTGRVQFAIYHTVFFQDEIAIRPGVPVLDLLNGSAMGSGGGQPRHEVEAQFGVTQKGLGARLSADWKSGTTVRGGAGAGPGTAAGDLSFSDIAKINLRLFADLGAQRDLVQKHRWLRGSRVTLSVTNLFDQRIEVKDAKGVTPLSYQPAYLDPLGRVVKLSVRKLFF